MNNWTLHGNSSEHFSDVNVGVRVQPPLSITASIIRVHSDP